MKSMKRSYRPIVFATMLIALGVAFYVSAGGGMATLLNTAPRLHYSTPSSQSGYELKQIQRIEDIGYSFILQSDWLPKIIPPTDSRNQEYEPCDAFQVTAEASTGSRWQLQWDVEKNWRFPNLGQEKYLFVTLPHAYPASYRYVDILLRDKKGRTARWRLTGLQRLKQVITPPEKPNRVFQHQGATVTAHAKWKYWIKHPNVPWLGDFLLTAVAKPAPGVRWEVHYIGTNFQWMSPEKPPLKGSEQTILTVPLSTKPNGGFGTVGPVPYPPDNQYVQIVGKLLKFTKLKSGNGESIKTTPFVLTVPVTDSGPVDKNLG